MAKSHTSGHQARWSPGPLGWLTLALLAAVMGLWTWVDAQEAAPMFEGEPSKKGVVIDPSKPWRQQVADSLVEESSTSWEQQVADSLAEQSVIPAKPVADETSLKDAPFEIYHNGKLSSRPRRPLPEPKPLPVVQPEPEPLPVPEVTDLPPAPARQPRVNASPDLRESLPPPDPIFEPETPAALHAPSARLEEDKEAAVELLHRARELAEQGSFESATWLILRAQQLATWTEADELRPDQVLTEVQAIQAERAETVKPVQATTHVLEEPAAQEPAMPQEPVLPEPAYRERSVREPAVEEPLEAAPAAQKLAEPEPRREVTASAPIIIQMPAAPAPIVTRTTFDDLAIPIAMGSLLVGCVLMVFMACGGALLALMQRMTRSAGPVTYRLEIAGKDGGSLLGPIQIIDNRPAVAPVMMGLPMMPGVMPAAAPAAPAQPAQTEEEIDPRTLDIPENPMLLPFNLTGTTFAEEQAQREGEERQREDDLIKHIFDKNVELQDELERLDQSAA